jgi:integrase
LDGSLDLVFTTPIGTPINPSNLNKRFHDALERAGLRRIRIDDLRQSCASLLLAQGESPRTILEILGQSQISLTMNTCSHVAPTTLRDAAIRMDRLLFGGE